MRPTEVLSEWRGVEREAFELRPEGTRLAKILEKNFRQVFTAKRTRERLLGEESTEVNLVDLSKACGFYANSLSKTHVCSCIKGERETASISSKWPLIHWPLWEMLSGNCHAENPTTGKKTPALTTSSLFWLDFLGLLTPTRSQRTSVEVTIACPESCHFESTCLERGDLSQKFLDKT